MYKSATSSLINRPDTMLGVCEGIGQTFGFHPNILRIAFAVCLLINPVAVIGTYLALGIAVAASRLLAPEKKAKAGVALAQVQGAAAEDEEDRVALAA